LLAVHAPACRELAVEVEAAALGNALVQGIAVGAYPSADAARATLRSMEDTHP